VEERATRAERDKREAISGLERQLAAARAEVLGWRRELAAAEAERDRLAAERKPQMMPSRASSGSLYAGYGGTPKARGGSALLWAVGFCRSPEGDDSSIHFDFAMPSLQWRVFRKFRDLPLNTVAIPQTLEVYLAHAKCAGVLTLRIMFCIPGGGSLRGVADMLSEQAAAANGGREQLPGVDVLYLKNVLLKFLDSIVLGRIEQVSLQGSRVRVWALGP
jgi:hypothetical protein